MVAVVGLYVGRARCRAGPSDAGLPAQLSAVDARLVLCMWRGWLVRGGLSVALPSFTLGASRAQAHVGAAPSHVVPKSTWAGDSSLFFPRPQQQQISSGEGFWGPGNLLLSTQWTGMLLLPLLSAAGLPCLLLTGLTFALCGRTARQGSGDHSDHS